MKLDPIKPAPPVTRIVFSINIKAAELQGPPCGEEHLLASGFPIVNKKDGNDPVLLVLHAILAGL